MNVMTNLYEETLILPRHVGSILNPIDFHINTVSHFFLGILHLNVYIKKPLSKIILIIGG